VDVYKDSAFVKTLTSEAWNFTQTWDGSGPTGFVGTKNGSGFGDGIYTFKVSSVDEAGNISEVKTKEVYVDTEGPNPPSLSSITHNGSDYAPVSPGWSTHSSPYITWADPGDNGGSGVSRYEVSVDGGNWTDLASQTFWHSTLADGDSRTVDTRAVDTLGNLGTAVRLTFRVDTVDPYFNSGPTVDINHTPENIWSTHNSPRITFSGADATSNVASYSVFIDGTEYVNKNSPWEQVLGDGTHAVIIRVYDNAGRYTDSSSYTFKIDTTSPNAPSISISHTPADVWSNHISPHFTWSDPGDGNGSGVSYYRGFIDGVDQGNVSSGWHPALSEGTHTVYIRAVDGVGYSSNSATFTFKIDTKPPAITGISDSPDPFSPGNPDGNKDSVTFYYTIDESATVSIYIDGLQKHQEAKAAGSYSFTWSPGSSIGEGSHNYYVNAIDQALNSSSSATNYFTVDNTPPSTPSRLSAISGNGLANLSWNPASGAGGYNVYRSAAYNSSYTKMNFSLISGTSYQDTGLSNGIKYWYKVKAADNAGNESGFSNYAAATPGILGNTKIIFISDRDGNSEIYRMNSDGSNQVRLTNSGLWEGDPSFSPDGTKIVFISKTGAGAPDVYKMNGDGSNQVKLTNNSAREYCPVYSPDGTKIIFETDRDANLKYKIYVMNTDGSNPIRLTNNNFWDRYPSFSPDGTKIIFYSDRDGNLEIYKTDAGGSNQVRLTNNISADSFPSFSPDGTKIVFCSNRDGGTYEIYIMDVDGSNQVRLTNNAGDDFCPRFSPDGTKIVFHGINNGQFQVFKMDISGSNLVQLTSTSVFDGRPFWSPFASGMGAFLVSDQVQVQQLTTLEAPNLLAPEDEANVRSLRPNFKWRHHRANTQEYRIDLAKNDAFSIAHQGFTKSANTGSQDKDDATLYHYTYAIHEFDPGLDRDTYYWRITALSTNEAVTSEVRSFTVASELTLTGITNYPNPFDPNKETTKIRYRLGADVDELKIRIYDITGSIVKNFTNCPTQGEGASIWDKFQDVDWDGRNDRGDLVVNGIYPFEVIARLGDKTVSGKGKIAVLK
jgi:TolB protein